MWKQTVIALVISVFCGYAEAQDNVDRNISDIRASLSNRQATLLEIQALTSSMKSLLAELESTDPILEGIVSRAEALELKGKVLSTALSAADFILILDAGSAFQLSQSDVENCITRGFQQARIESIKIGSMQLISAIQAQSGVLNGLIGELNTLDGEFNEVVGLMNILQADGLLSASQEDSLSEKFASLDKIFQVAASKINNWGTKDSEYIRLMEDYSRQADGALTRISSGTCFNIVQGRWVHSSSDFGSRSVCIRQNRFALSAELTTVRASDGRVIVESYTGETKNNTIVFSRNRDGQIFSLDIFNPNNANGRLCVTGTNRCYILSGSC